MKTNELLRAALPAMAMLGACVLLGTGCLDPETATACASDEDCVEGSVCLQGMCVMVPDDDADPDTTSGELDGEDVPVIDEDVPDTDLPPVDPCAGLDCGEAADGTFCGYCGLNESCEAGLCVSNEPCATIECGESADGFLCGSCGLGLVCKAGVCVTSEDPCAALECGEAQDGSICGYCPVSEVCEAGACVAVDPCAEVECGYGSDGDSVCGFCGIGDVCQAGTCVADFEAGEVGASCDGNEDCSSGWCVPALPEGGVCTQTCTDGAGPCPLGMVCHDVAEDISLCVPPQGDLCTPCDLDGDCYGGLCVPSGDGYSYCSASCEDAPCPTGYQCAAAADAGNICIPTDPGACNCFAWEPGATAACQVSNSFGTCGGVFGCAEGGGYTPCDAATPALEVCDGFDNDCDGQVDPELSGQSCDNTNEWGSCPGVLACDAGGGLICAAPTPAQEICNGIDDDCDGLLDDGIDPGSSPCLSVGVCQVGVLSTCIGSGGWACDYAGVANYEPGAEVSCDGVDNDCDGAVDESLGGAPCSSDNGFGQCWGVMGCAGVGGMVCTASTPAADDTCDGIDNDCDGIPDDGVGDADGDGYSDCVDGCPNDHNPDQADWDNDGMQDACDPCPASSGSNCTSQFDKVEVKWTDTDPIIAIHTTGDVSRDWSWSCMLNDPAGYPVTQTCEVWDVTFGNPGAPGSVLVDSVDCGASATGPTSVSNTYDVPPGSLISGHKYYYSAKCADSLGNDFRPSRWFYWDVEAPTTSIDGSAPGAGSGETLVFDLTCSEDSFDYDFSSSSGFYTARCMLDCTLEVDSVVVMTGSCDDSFVESASEVAQHEIDVSTPGEYCLTVTPRDLVGNEGAGVPTCWTVE